jgi:hypothetical protein
MARILHLAMVTAASVLALIPAAMASDNINIPEPASLTIFAAAAGTLALLRRRG